MSTNWFEPNRDENSFPAFPYTAEGLPPSSPYASHDASETPPPPHNQFTSRRNVLFIILGAVGIIVLLFATLFILGGGNTTTPKPVVAAVADATVTNSDGTSTATQNTTSNGPATYAPTSTYPPTSTTVPGHAAPTPYPTYTPYPTNVPYPTYTPPPAATATNTAIPIQTLTDNLNDWSHTYAHDPDLALNTGGAGVLWGDTSVAYRQNVAPDTITWKQTNILQANFTCYFDPNQPMNNQGFAISSDGTHWNTISPIVASQAGQNGNWTKSVYTLNGLTNTNFVKMTWLDTNVNGTPECGQAVITYQS